MTLSIEELKRIIVNHEEGIQLTGVEVYRQLLALMIENEELKAEVDSLEQRAMDDCRCANPN